MQDILNSLYVIGITIVVIILIFVLSKISKNKKKEQIKQLADTKGWKYAAMREPNVWGTVLETTDWRFEAISHSLDSGTDHLSDVKQNTWWYAKNSHPGLDKLLMVGPRPNEKLSANFEHLFIQKAASFYLGDSQNNVHEISLPTKEFNEKYIVLSNQESFAMDLINATLQRELLQWEEKKSPVIKLMKDEISIVIEGIQLENPDKIASLIHMGEILQSNLKINQY